jgi:single-strand DNA-binding protein
LEYLIVASYNRVILMGNLTRDPELRYIQSGMAVTNLDLAVNDRRKTATGEWVEEVTFVNDVTVWGRQAETACEFLTKGSPVLIEGRLKLDAWEKDGQKHSKLKVVCERMQFVGGRGGSGGPGGDRPQGASRPAQRGSSGGSQYNQSGPPDYADDVPPPEASGGGGGGNGGDDIPF